MISIYSRSVLQALQKIKAAGGKLNASQLTYKQRHEFLIFNAQNDYCVEIKEIGKGFVFSIYDERTVDTHIKILTEKFEKQNEKKLTR